MVVLVSGKKGNEVYNVHKREERKFNVAISEVEKLSVGKRIVRVCCSGCMP